MGDPVEDIIREWEQDKHRMKWSILIILWTVFITLLIGIVITLNVEGVIA